MLQLEAVKKFWVLEKVKNIWGYAWGFLLKLIF